MAKDLEMPVGRTEAKSARFVLLEDSENNTLLIELRLELETKEMRVSAGLNPDDAVKLGQRMVAWGLLHGAKADA
jgi:hypothetical protein